MNKARKQKRLALIRQLGQLEETNCNSCTIRPPTAINSLTVCAQCPIYKQIRAIGEELGTLAKENRVAAAVEIKAPFKKPVRIEISVEQYHEMRNKGLSDLVISKMLKVTHSTLFKWKKRFGITEKSNVSEVKPVAKEAKITIEAYQGYRAKGLKDKGIAERVGMSLSALYQFKSLNGLSSKKTSEVKKVEKVKAIEIVEVAADEIDVVVEESLPVEVIEPPAPTVEDKLIQLNYEVERLEREKELWRTSQKNTQNKLFDLSAEYRKLEIDFLDESRENNRLKEMLEKMKETAMINVWLMKQHVGFMEQLDSVVDNKEAGEFVWR